MSAAIITYSTLLVSKFIIQLLFILNIISLYFYLRNVYYYLVRPAAYKIFTIESISSYGNFLIFFLISAALYGFQSFLNIKVWPLMMALLAITALIVYQMIWANKIDLSRGMIYILISCLVILELSWSVSFLPLNHNIAGLIIAICYYMLTGLIRHYLLDKLDKEKIKSYLGFGMASLFIILFAAKWM